MMTLLTKRAIGSAAEFFHCLSLDLGFVQLVPLGHCLNEVEILDLVCRRL